MEIRKGKKKYVVFLNSRTMICTLTSKHSTYDFNYSSLIPNFECTFREAVNNLKAAKDKGFLISKKRND